MIKSYDYVGFTKYVMNMHFFFLSSPAYCVVGIL